MKKLLVNYKGFKDLDSYKKGRELRIYISQLVKTFPASERYLLTNQIVDCSRSITRNIAEGYGRFTYADTRNFFIIARGSVTETIEQLITACDESYITEEQLMKGEQMCDEILKLINGYIFYLDKSKRTKG